MNFFIVGRTLLAVRCAELIVNSGQCLLAVCSTDPLLVDWCKCHHIACYSFPRDLLGVAKKHEIDYLLSVVNPSILSEELLAIPNHLAINYHDALLPFYAGIHATSWAIYNREKSHGVSWHVMTERLDDGDILKQQSLEISERETALSLNMKCHEAAFSCFSLLLPELLNSSYHRARQDLSKRTYYGRNKTLPNVGVVDWNTSAKYIDRLSRASNLGQYDNEFGIVKFILDNQLIHFSVLEITQKKSSRTPGSIINIADEYLEISTTTTNIRISCFINLFGRHFSARELAEEYSLSSTCLLSIQNTPSDNQYFSKILVYERFWVSQFISAQPMHLNYLAHD